MVSVAVNRNGLKVSMKVEEKCSCLYGTTKEKEIHSQ